MKLRFTILLVGCFISMIGSTEINGQVSIALDITQHQWQRRVVIVLTRDVASELYTQQLEELLKIEKELEERKTIYYTITPRFYQMGYERKVVNKNAWLKYQKPERSFLVMLVGLDGDIKLQKTEVLTAKDLFGTIDSMPMRRSEMRKRQE